MKPNYSFRSFFMLFAGLFFSLHVKAQVDSIAKTGGDVIPVKIIEIGTNAVSYTRTDFKDSPTFVIDKKDILYIRLKNGEKQVYAKTTVPVLPDTKSIPGNTVPVTSSGDNNYLKAGPVSNEYRIEYMNKKYTINGKKAGSKDVDRLLCKSTNPTVQATAKTAKAIKIAQKIIGLTSIATTAGGGVTSIATISQFVTAYQTKTLTPKYYVNAGVSLLGTMSLPITSKILKNRRDKLYDKAIDLYNLKN